MFLGSLFSHINLTLPVVNTLYAFVLERTVAVSVLSGVFLAVLMIFICSLSQLFFFLGEAGSCLYILKKRDGICPISVYLL